MNKSTDVLVDAVSIPVNVDPTLTMSCPGESNSIKNIETVASTIAGDLSEEHKKERLKDSIS